MTEIKVLTDNIYYDKNTTDQELKLLDLENDSKIEFIVNFKPGQLGIEENLELDGRITLSDSESEYKNFINFKPEIINTTKTNYILKLKNFKNPPNFLYYNDVKKDDLLRTTIITGKIVYKVMYKHDTKGTIRLSIDDENSVSTYASILGQNSKLSINFKFKCR